MALKQCGSCSVQQSENTKISSCVCGKTGYCSLQCQKKDWKTHKKDCPAYIRKVVEGKGQGLVATRKIKAGQEVGMCRDIIIVQNNLNDHQTVSRIMEEFDILSEEDQAMVLSLSDEGECSPLNKDNPLNNYVSRVKEEFDILSEEEKAMVLSLSDKDEEYEKEWYKLNRCDSVGQDMYCRFGGEEKVRKVVRIYWQNISSSDSKWKLHLTQVLMNHSCAPNATVLNKKGQLVIFALMDIQKGDEVVESYFPGKELEQPRGGREERMYELKSLYGFTCRCKICTLTGEELMKSDQIRRNIKSGYSKLSKMKDLVSTADYLEAAEDLVALLNKIPHEMIHVQREMLSACYTVREGKLPRVEPKVYKSKLYQVVKGFGLDTVKETNKMVQQTQMILQTMGGGKYLHMF